MATDTFRAGVTYGDWTGTASADNLDQQDLHDLLVAKKLMNREKEFLIGASLYVGENNVGAVQAPFISAIITTGSDYDTVKASIGSQRRPIQTRRVDLELTLEQFIGLFKRFHVVLTKQGLHLEDQEYEWQED